MPIDAGTGKFAWSIEWERAVSGGTCYDIDIVEIPRNHCAFAYTTSYSWQRIH
jgi:hypothetical protein